MSQSSRKRGNNNNKKSNRLWTEFSLRKINKIKKYLIGKNTTNIHVMIELTHMDYHRVKHNCIVFSGLSVEFTDSEKRKRKNAISSFSSLSYGENIRYTTESTNDITKIVLQTPRTKGKYVFGIIAKDEIEKSVFGDKVVFIESSISHKSMSGMVLLFTTQQHNNTGDHEWNDKDIKKLRYSKHSTVGNKTHPHFGASGEYYSFGVSAVYKVDDGSSVGKYANKRHKVEEKSIIMNMYATQLEKQLIDSMATALQHLSTICYNVYNWIAPVVDVAYNLQIDNGDINIKNSVLFQLGVPQAQICVNATTAEFHTEFDQSLTYICVPKQKMEGKNWYEFLFKINSSTVLSLPMSIGLNILFSATFLTHRQHCNNRNKHMFLNFASFSNKKLLRHMIKSFERVQN